MEFFQPISLALIVMPVLGTAALISLAPISWYLDWQDRRLMKQIQVRYAKGVQKC